jgi:hypothetical protein
MQFFKPFNLYSDLTGTQNALYSRSPGTEDGLGGHTGFISGKEPFGYHPNTG